jgi:hypothetical protein
MFMDVCLSGASTTEGFYSHSAFKRSSIDRQLPSKHQYSSSINKCPSDGLKNQNGDFLDIGSNNFD